MGKWTFLKKTFFILFFLCISSFSSFASSISDYLDKILFSDLQLQAVTVDMYLYIGWFPEKKEWMREASQKAINDLEELASFVKESNPPKSLVNLKEEFLKLIDKLKEIYQGIEKKDEKEIEKEFTLFTNLYNAFIDGLKKALKDREFVKLPEDFKQIDQETKLIKSKEDKSLYLEALRFMKEKHFKKAYEILSQLKDKYKDTAFSDCIMLKISDCWLMSFSDMEDENGFLREEKGIKILEDIINSKRYSPVLFEAFYKWRTSTQAFYYGMSNMSQIPNKMYNQKRWQLIKLIKKYLKTHPQDIWAKRQIDLLLSLPNIERGGSFGNSNLAHWGVFFADLDKKAEEISPSEKK